MHARYARGFRLDILLKALIAIGSFGLCSHFCLVNEWDAASELCFKSYGLFPIGILHKLSSQVPVQGTDETKACVVFLWVSIYMMGNKSSRWEPFKMNI